MSATAAIHAGLRQLGIEQDDARDLYERVTGKRSLREMSDRERQGVVQALRQQGFKPASKRLQGRFAKKLQALWIAAWNLGLVRDRTDAALVSFVKRQTGIDHVRFVRDAADAAKAIEALKAWLSRDGGVDWSDAGCLPGDWQRRPGARIAMAQWAMLAKAGLVAPGFPAFSAFAEDRAFNPLGQMTDREWAGIMNTLGERVRTVRR